MPSEFFCRLIFASSFENVTLNSSVYEFMNYIEEPWKHGICKGLQHFYGCIHRQPLVFLAIKIECIWTQYRIWPMPILFVGCSEYLHQGFLDFDLLVFVDANMHNDQTSKCIFSHFFPWYNRLRRKTIKPLNGSFIPSDCPSLIG